MRDLSFSVIDLKTAARLSASSFALRRSSSSALFEVSVEFASVALFSHACRVFFSSSSDLLHVSSCVDRSLRAPSWILTAFFCWYAYRPSAPHPTKRRTAAPFAGVPGSIHRGYHPLENAQHGVFCGVFGWSSSCFDPTHDADFRSFHDGSLCVRRHHDRQPRWWRRRRWQHVRRLTFPVGRRHEHRRQPRKRRDRLEPV